MAFFAPHAPATARATLVTRAMAAAGQPSCSSTQCSPAFTPRGCGQCLPALLCAQAIRPGGLRQLTCCGGGTASHCITNPDGTQTTLAAPRPAAMALLCGHRSLCATVWQGRVCHSYRAVPWSQSHQQQCGQQTWHLKFSPKPDVHPAVPQCGWHVPGSALWRLAALTVWERHSLICP